MKIALLTLGTRGDVQPFAVLGQALKEKGHQVTLSTGKNFESFVKSFGIDFIPVDADFQAFMESDEGKKMMKNPFRAKKHLHTWVYPMVYNSLNTFYSIAKENDRVLFHVKTLANIFADQFPEKMIRADVIPALQPTSAFINPVFSGLGLPRVFNKLSYKLTALGLKMMNYPIRKFRKDAGLSANLVQRNLPGIYGISSHFLKKPDDYPANHYFTGFWVGEKQTELEDELITWLNEGEPPLLFTLGSMPFQSKLNLSQVLTRIISELKIRIIVIRGWGLNDTVELENHPAVKVIGSAPYDKLFPLVKAVVHHGGIGTIASCLYAGKPFLSCPVLYPLGDQHFWGTIAYKKGIALKPLPIIKLTENILIGNVKSLLNTPHLYSNSIKLMKLLKEENGTLNAINIIEK